MAMPVCTSGRSLNTTRRTSNHRRLSCVRIGIGLLLSVLGMCRSATADPMTYQLFVVATTGPLAGQSSAGTVTFDSSIIPSGGGRVIGQHLFTNVDFEWNGISYSASTTETSFLQFDTRSLLTQWDFGTICNSPANGGCLVRLFGPGVADWVVKNNETHSLFFEYGRADHSFGFGMATLAASPTPTPEPMTAGLLAIGVAAFCARRCRVLSNFASDRSSGD